MTSNKPHDLIILGGGTSGIVSARLYLDIHPSADIVVIERDGSVGGTWSRDRSYPGFKAQASSRMCEFSDIPISIPPGGSDEYDCPASIHISEYLEIYLEKHIYDGKPLKDRFLFNSLVIRVNKGIDGLWKVCFTQSGEEKEMQAVKLLVATGTTSLPQIPDLKGRDMFKGPIIHSIDFGRSWSNIQTSSFQNITVLGAGKSAADFVYQLVKAGKSVTWLFRESGKGAGSFVSPKGPPGFRNIVEIASTRTFSHLFLSGLKRKGWWDWWLWDTWGGRKFRKQFDNFAISSTISSANFDGREGARDGFKLLKTEEKPNFILSPAGMVHYSDFWDTVAQNVDIVRADIETLEYHKIILSNGSSIDADAILLGTGYLDKLPFFSDDDCIALGLPHKKSSEQLSEKIEWERLESNAEKEILKLYPVLKTEAEVPKHLGDIDTEMSPYRLYHGVGPLNGDPTIAFVGFAIHPNMFESAEVTALWAVAYLDGSIKLPEIEEMKKDVAYTNTYMRLRIPTYGRLGNFYLYDKFAHYDQLLDKDLGLKRWHPKGWWAYWTSPSMPNNLKGLKDEYLEKYCRQICN